MQKISLFLYCFTRFTVNSKNILNLVYCVGHLNYRYCQWHDFSERVNNYKLSGERKLKCNVLLVCTLIAYRIYKGVLKLCKMCDLCLHIKLSSVGFFTFKLSSNDCFILPCLGMSCVSLTLAHWIPIIPNHSFKSQKMLTQTFKNLLPQDTNLPSFVTH